ncbi:hypothetical protein DFJ58DRAFT_741730 [Suillus subalutaceus]|uniref:uncharacterized protein n=1 Tax=Suillus subalutaceus TaxID=48586 RepID=UPI001B867D97|nr:uncharacterized protein DFJ58DRAFT_741730 [Suillus subalutaceus]KAG1873062.1 hypothetical protein DFJ58DRAFT_741730 [Suillus subalutaceus]
MPFESPLSFLTGASASSRLSWSHFNLDFASGIAIFFGGKAALSALALQPLYGRIWHGWYNAPGCHAIVWELVRTLLQGSVSSYSERLSLSLGLDGKKGPKYIASRSGTVMQHTRHLAYVLNNSKWRGNECKPVVVGERRSPTPMQLIIVDLKKKVLTGNNTLPPRSSLHSSLPIIASATSIVACAICASVDDWLSFKMILLGIVSSGITSFIMCTAKITLERLKPADGVPPGDGMLLSDNRIVILRGNEEDVNAVTKGKLRLKLKGGGYTLLPCAFIALSQVTLQLVFMPFGSLPGQLMFLLSLLVSGGCNLYLSAKEDDVQSSALITLLNTPEVKTYEASSRASAAVLACLALCWESGTPPKQILKEIVPIEPRVWKAWSEFLEENIRKKSTHFMYGDNESTGDLDNREGKLLLDLIDDAHAAYDQYIKDHK